MLLLFLAIMLTNLTVSLVFATNASFLASSSTVVKVEPASRMFWAHAVGQEFTVAIQMIDVTNLYGFDIGLRWNTTVLEYVSHMVRIPKDNYADGILWNPILPVKDEINATTGTYCIAYSSMHPAPSFNGSGTVFTITFRVIYHPQEPEPTAEIRLELYHTQLVDRATSLISHTVQDGIITLHQIQPININPFIIAGLVAIALLTLIAIYFVKIRKPK
jgi:hypothetical protein